MKSAAAVLAQLQPGASAPKKRMKRASYRDGIAWIALNDDPASPDSKRPEIVAGYVSSCLLADLFGVPMEKVGRAVVRYRRKHGVGS